MFNEMIEALTSRDEGRPMDLTDLTTHLTDLDGVRVLELDGGTFYIHDPRGDLPDERLFPFVTVATDDRFDAVSDLDHPGAYRVNIGLPKADYLDLLGPAPTTRDADGILRAGVDYSARDTLLPHPHYAAQYWVCVVNPARTAEQVRELTTRAHAFAARKTANQERRHRATP